MDGLKVFFIILLFGKSFLLTPNSISLDKAWTDIPLESPISAITPGAALHIDVTQPSGNERDYLKLKKKFPPGLLEAKLTAKEGKEIALYYADDVSFTRSAVSLILQAKEIPTQTKFVRLVVRAQRPLSDIKITWQNYSK